MEKGLKGLAELVPGGGYALEVAEEALKKYREQKKDAEQRAEIEELAQSTFEHAKDEARRAINEALAERGTPIPISETLQLEQWLSGIPEAARISLRRPEDISGRSVPVSFSLRSRDDVLRLLPPQPPRFTPGSPLPGKPGWILDRLLGVGGFGEVWFARNARMTSLSGAVKFCHGQAGEILRHEGNVIDRLMSAGRHPNIVPLTDADLDAEIPWLMYEYVPGGTLTDWIHSLGKVTPESRISKVTKALGMLADAVGHFHRHHPPIIHRDLKPSNILLDSKQRKLKITDFGIGSVAAVKSLSDEKTGKTSREGRLLSNLRGSHTPLYASPQQRNGDDPDPRDDVHALGVIAYQMLTGSLEHGAGSDFAEDLKEAGVSDQLAELLGKCIAQKARRRPADARVLAEELTTLGGGKPASVAVLPPVTLKPAEVIVKPLTIDSEAAYLEGVRCYKGDGVTKDLRRAFQLFVTCAIQGHAAAQFYLGFMCANGLGVSKDEKQAAEWYRKAADQGHAVAQYSLGIMCANGRGMSKDATQAVEWYRKAAEQGLADAQYNLAVMHANGQGVSKDEKQAVEWYRKAADQGYANAQYNLGVMCEHGQGVAKDEKQAVEWYRKAADQGKAVAQYNLGVMYARGKGVAKDEKQAVEWYQKAAEQGHENAREELKRLT